MSFFDEIDKLFGTTNLYEVLGIEKNANEKQIKKAYRTLSLRYHPDRSDEQHKDTNKVKFQVISRIHLLLSNSKQREVYDESGELLDESDVCLRDRDWEEYWRLFFKKITVEEIEEFEKSFKGSDSESKELKLAYVRFKGDMAEILGNVPCSSEDDVERFREIVNNAVEKGELPAFEEFNTNLESKAKKRRAKAEKEKVEAEQHAKFLDLDQNGDLKSLILQRHVDREKEMGAFIDNLEAKYSKKSKKSNNAATTTKKGTKRKRK